MRSGAENTCVGDDVIVLDGIFGGDVVVVVGISEEDAIVVDGIFGDDVIVVDVISGDDAFVVDGISGEDASVVDCASTFFTSTSASSICWDSDETSLSPSRAFVTASVSPDALCSTSACISANSSPSREVVDDKVVTTSKSKGGAGRDRHVLDLQRQLATNTSFRH